MTTQHHDPNRPSNRYIGDGVYASHDGYQIVLETSDGISVTNRIALDDLVLDDLDRYRKYVQKFYRELREVRKSREAPEKQE